MQIDREQLAIWQECIDYIAAASAALGQAAGVGGMETAGALISYLHRFPKDLEPFVNGGIFELPMDWALQGSLTWHAQKDGRVMSPEYVRQHHLIAKMKKGASHAD